MMSRSRLLALLLAGPALATAYTETHCQDSKQAIVHLFEWSHDAVADECEKVLNAELDIFCLTELSCGRCWGRRGSAGCRSARRTSTSRATPGGPGTRSSSAQTWGSGSEEHCRSSELTEASYSQ